jgi:hypothetical protein
MRLSLFDIIQNEWDINGTAAGFDGFCMQAM